MRRTPEQQAVGGCRNCGRRLSACCRSGYCEWCRGRHRCGMCDFVGPEVIRSRCPACLAVVTLLSGLPRGPRPPRHLRRGLVERYESRAAARLPLFTTEGV